MVTYTLDSASNQVNQNARTLPVIARADVVVAGGGPAGLTAAVAAARAGAKVMLIERNSFLGGVATAVMMTAFVASNHAAGIGRELLDRLYWSGGAPLWDGAPDRTRTTPFDAESLKTVALEMVEDAGAELLLYSTVTNPLWDGSRVFGVAVENKGGCQAIVADITVDATGDADLAARVAPFQMGRESDDKMRPMALLFRLGGVNLDDTLAYARANPDQIQPQYREGTILQVGQERITSRLSGFYDLVDTARNRGELDPDCHYFRFETGWIDRGVVMVNTTRVYGVDGTDARDLTRAELAARRQIAQLVTFSRKYIPGCQNAYLLDTAASIGVRESRRIIGRYTLTQEDVYANRRFADSILAIRQNVPRLPLPPYWDVHSPDPGEGSRRDLLERRAEPVEMEEHAYEVPYRCMLPQNVENLLVAGRSISVDHMIDGFTRNMLIAMLFGQAAGTAAAVALGQGAAPSQVLVDVMQSELAAAGVPVSH